MTDTALLEQPLTGAPTSDLVDALSTALDEPAWLRDHRCAALDAYQRTAWPALDQEEWRRTPMDDVPLDHFCLVTNGAGSHALPTLPAEFNRPAGLIFHNDAHPATPSPGRRLSRAGVIFLPLSQAARDHEDLVRPHLNTIIPADQDRFTALTAALWSQGLFCYIPADVTLDEPLLHLLQKTTAGQGIFGHTLIVAEANTSFTLLESASSDTLPPTNPPTPSLSHRTIEIIAGQNADVRLIEVQNWGNDVHAFVTQRTRQARDARVQLTSAAFGGRLSKERIDVDLTGDGSQADIVGIFVAQDDQHIEYNTRQDHHGLGATSNLLIKGAITDNAAAVQYGVIKIWPEGQKAGGYQTMRNLLLSEGASADPIPVLEIEADDVQCSHAAAVGPVDPEHLFYLESRGIPPEQAKHMVVQGFLDVATERLKDERVRTYVQDLIAQKLNQATDGQADRREPTT